MRKRFYIGLCLFLLPLLSISSLEISEQQGQELTQILATYTELTASLKTTLVHQRATLEQQQKTIQQLSTSFQDLKKIMKDLENSFLAYKKAQKIKDYIMYSLVGGLAVTTIILIFRR